MAYASNSAADTDHAKYANVLTPDVQRALTRWAICGMYAMTTRPMQIRATESIRSLPATSHVRLSYIHVPLGGFPHSGITVHLPFGWNVKPALASLRGAADDCATMSRSEWEAIMEGCLP